MKSYIQLEKITYFSLKGNLIKSMGRPFKLIFQISNHVNQSREYSMGWEPNVNVWLTRGKRGNARELCFRCLKYLESSSLFGSIIRVCVIKERQYYGRPEKGIMPKSEGDVEIDEIAELFSEFNEKLWDFEVWYETINHHVYEVKTIYNKRHISIIEEPYRVVLSFPSEEYVLPGIPVDADIVVEIGKEIYLCPSYNGELAELNILALVYQLAVLIEFGAIQINLPNKDNELDPKTFHLVYHSDPDEFRKDLLLWTQYISPQITLSTEDIRLIIQSCDDIEYMEIRGGILVFHKNLVEGSLESLYTKIIEFLEEH
jgi:hypothetical protein